MLAATAIVLSLTLSTVGAGSDAGRVDPLTGVVVGPDGSPASGAEVVASGGGWDGGPPALLGRALTDEGGRFVLAVVEEPSGRDRPTLWATLPGSVVASAPIDRDPVGRRDVRLTLGSGGRAEFLVFGPDGRPVAGARVVPRVVAREGSEVPGLLAGLASATTDDRGRAVVSAFRPEELLAVRVEADGFGVQPREFRSEDGLADPGPKAIRLLPAGRVRGRVVADDPASVAGLTILVGSASDGRGVGDSGIAEASTDLEGRFEVPAIASGMLTVRARPRGGSPDLPARVVRRPLEAGGSVQVEIPMRRGVRVGGVALDDRDGRPIAGVVVSVEPSGPAGPSTARTDADGRYEAFVPAGLVSHRVLKVPAPYLAPPPFVGPRPVEVPPAIARFELPGIALARGGILRGSVVGEGQRPVAGARVVASWTFFDGRARAPRSGSTTSRLDGSFALGPVPLDAWLAVSAEEGGSSSSGPTPTRLVDDRAVELTLVEGHALPPNGRVVDLDGRPIVGASVRIWAIARPGDGPGETMTLARPGGSDEWETDLDGRFRATRPVRRDREYRAVASLKGYLPARSRPLRPSGPDASTFADLVLTPEARRGVLEGRVIDRRGRPVVGASSWAWADGPARRRAATDGDGRFRLVDVPQGPGFLFVEADGFRFQGIEAGPRPRVDDITLTRLDEDPASTMTTRPLPSGCLDLARRLIAPYADRVLSEGDHSTRVRTLELLARVDPQRILALVDAQGVEDSWFADHLRHAASRSLAGPGGGERMAIVEAIRDAEWRVLGALDAADALPRSARALRREWVEHALRDARTIPEPSRRVVAMAKVADRLVDLAEVDRARRLLDEARPIAQSLPLTTSSSLARVEFAEALARVDPAGALALTEGLVDPEAFDRGRVRIAQRLAAREPGTAAAALESLRDPRALAKALPALCHALAPVDPVLARRLVAGARGDHPCLPAYALGMMAGAVAGRDKPAATAWLREAFERLDHVASAGSTPPGASHDPSTVAAALLPVAERVDPSLVPELFWRALSLHAPPPGQGARSTAILALLLGRYDRQVATRLLDPLLDGAAGSPEGDLAPLVAAAAILDPDRAIRLVEAMPEAPDLTFHHPKNSARLALAAALARGHPACWDDATARFLHLWVEGSPDPE